MGAPVCPIFFFFFFFFLRNQLQLNTLDCCVVVGGHACSVERLAEAGALKALSAAAISPSLALRTSVPKTARNGG